ncbi:3-phosphoserine/phosphohydroxythreonine aminotransferase [Bacillus pseudomycoides]|uniref:Phosphoserine aminotransferase n=1 Tax=Bacillus pseudomycoides TaxID=64104 RepID=A0AA91VCF7_9BACI|nr:MULTISPECIES: 3-phosphoserine/phosphohydroxythreonine transaminase [Bacillus]PEB47575.1 3-phosphoserine/phosphohydroxythreonine aminotransferase [Bacillus sp. AFS098217]PED82522.1 3-phosphoserine/phosphohydroxythreonine aminotransferase [Bacillus pseudomycoides]PEU11556.1 3-phosphoserine/phosphohydroxythreonine aminotransferase [Bacillus sp. AFS014408]PEU17284.1 3-phosphoserine/phosphohydroxythreonine aminotransferase [Bacillus sp. AFS019443]PFW60752.1 3-phosphoserine/phosphohydroxythreonin
MERVYNFSAGPSILPLPVLEKVQKELLNYNGTGMSIMEMSHRSSHFQNIIEEASSLLRELMHIPDNYDVLFLQGGASLQFSMVPLNVMNEHKRAGYVLTGSWSKKALQEAEKVGEIKVIASSEQEKFTTIPRIDTSMIHPELDYIHITTNNTIEGTKYVELPQLETIPLVADMSSNILSEEYDVEKFGLIYAGAQKNLGPAGLTIAIIKKDLIGKANASCPVMLNYETYSKNNSLYNTPPSFSIYVTKLVLEWLKEQGGVPAIEEQNRKKASLLYRFLDESELFTSPVDPKYRSLMNIPFTTPSEELNEQFLQRAKALGLVTLKGHRSVGGMRASIYNAMPIEGVQKLVDYMKDFELENR